MDARNCPYDHPKGNVRYYVESLAHWEEAVEPMNETNSSGNGKGIQAFLRTAGVKEDFALLALLIFFLENVNGYVQAGP
jgi:hypothetical protein